MDDFELELKMGFLEEASQLLTDAEQCFLALETSPGDTAILEKIFRLAHNLKGSAKAVGFDQLGEFTHELESYMLKLKTGAIQVTPASVSLLLRCNDHVMKMVASLKENADSKTDSTDLLNEIKLQMEGGGAAEAAAPEPAPAIVEEPAAIAEVPSANDVGFEEAAELMAAETSKVIETYSQPVAVAPTSAPAPKVEEKKTEKAANANAPAADESIRVSLGRLEKLMNFVGELVILQTVLREQIATNHPSSRKTVHQLGKVTKEVQDISMSLRMVPVKQTFQKMQRIVRDTSAALGKKVNLEISGEETELDKTVLERISDPLVHLIRNSCDHGIESAELRKERGKAETGQVKLSAYHQSGSLIIEIADDGAGLDPKKLTDKAIEKGLLKPGTQLAEKDAYQLIFASGFSTKAVVTDVSGRGVGMDVVKTNIEQLQGDIQIETQVGKGTCFKIRLPLTLAIVDAMVIRSEADRFIIPLSHVHESIKPSESDVHFVSGMGEVFCLRGENLPLFRLPSLLNKKVQAKSASDGIAIVVRTQQTSFSVLVDDIIGQHQVVIKQLGEEHRGLKGFSGSAILGDGRPSLILELPDLVSRHQSKPATTAAPAPRAEAKRSAA